MTIVWSSTMETGIPQIDVQHQELVNIVNELDMAHASGQSAAALDDILPRLTVYALFHFGEEETLLAQVAEGSAFAEHHRQEHQSFVAEIQRLVASRANQSDQDLTEVLTLYLADWLVLHISGTDQALARLLSAKSRQTRAPTSADGFGR